MTSQPRLILLESHDSASLVLDRYDPKNRTLRPPENSDLWSAVEHAHALGRRGQGQRIAIIDSDCDLNLGRLKEQVRTHRSWVPPGGKNPDIRHGTAVALMISAIAPESELEVHNVVMDSGMVDQNAVAAAMEDVTSSRANVVNLSLGVETLLTKSEEEAFVTGVRQDPLGNPRSHLTARHDPNCVLCPAVEKAASQNVLVVTAAGNRKDTVSCPARAKGAAAALYLGMTFRIRKVGTEYAERGVPRLPHQSESILADWMVREDDSFRGTSFAAPIITGMAALCASQEEFQAYRTSNNLAGQAAARLNAVDLNLIPYSDKVRLAEESRDDYLQALRLLPHVHFPFPASRHPPSHWTDPSGCPTCGVFAIATYVSAGAFFLDGHNPEAARSLLWPAHRFAPWSAYAAADLAATLNIMGDPRQALELYDLALRIRPGFKGYTETRRLIQEAVSHQEKPELSPRDVDPRAEERELGPPGQAYLRAREYFQRALNVPREDDPGYPAYDEASVRSVEAEAKNGRSEAQCLLAAAHIYHRGLREPQTPLGIELAMKAARAGSAPAQTLLGESYLSGTGAPQDRRIAVEWFELAAEKNFPKALMRLAEAHELGLGVPQDYPKALGWTQRLAAQGNVPAMEHVALYFSLGFRPAPLDPKWAQARWHGVAEERDSTAGS